MILTHKTGVLLHGTLAKDPVFKDVGQKQVLKFDVKAHSVKADTGSWESLFVQVNVWHGLDKWDGMLLKGDAVTVFARELKTREYNGKTYYSVDADDIQPGGLVLFRWMQNLIDLCTEPPASPEPVLTDEPTPFDESEPVPEQTSLFDGQGIGLLGSFLDAGPAGSRGLSGIVQLHSGGLCIHMDFALIAEGAEGGGEGFPQRMDKGDLADHGGLFALPQGFPGVVLGQLHFLVAGTGAVFAVDLGPAAQKILVLVNRP